jgi:predicted metalloprotease with PDZ domain
VIPTTTVSVLTERALSAGLSMGETVVAVAVAGDEEERAQITQAWNEWQCGVPIEVLIDPQRSLVRTVLQYVRSVEHENATITVLIPIVVPRKRRHEILHNQRGRLLEAALKARTDVIVATLPFHLHD